ncbi:hypothetical protein BC939DRAFT_188747 [Gamsiella multidivaricata]|uniref:uncharacterized protein n=1 Tax=Gamsiella multidivaricata TaxID=101098 RepID=UPI002220E5BF|nr:uncharacterized protein BC939DRAFT_188747 [Gamsiella multidivaricata]KAI7831552.1 hypothetical protein BC939DRAFT_188747 [Gamsiella multidivaricata]
MLLSAFRCPPLHATATTLNRLFFFSHLFFVSIYSNAPWIMQKKKKKKPANRRGCAFIGCSRSHSTPPGVLCHIIFRPPVLLHLSPFRVVFTSSTLLHPIVPLLFSCLGQGRQIKVRASCRCLWAYFMRLHTFPDDLL